MTAEPQPPQQPPQPPRPVVTSIGGVDALLWPAGVPLEDAGREVVGEAWGTGVTLVVLPTDVLPPGFFDLSTGVAGDLLQRLVSHRLRVALVGDIRAHVAASGALTDLVWESNRGRQVWFVPDDAALVARLERA